MIARRNGLLNIDTHEVTPHDPTYFNVNCLPFDYDPDAPKPKRWLKFLEDIWPNQGDQEAEDCLQEIFGLMLTPDTSFQKIFLILGPPRSGKGTMAAVLTSLLDADNIANPQMKSLGSSFGLAPLINKRMAIISDARLGSGERKAVVETLLSVSGEDSLTIDRKYQSHWTGKLAVRFLILSNELPGFVDDSGAIASRIILLVLEESFLGREDKRLKTKLEPELPSILNWALEGLQRLQARGYFEMPSTSEAVFEQWEEMTSPVTAFVRQCCRLGRKCEIVSEKLWEKYKQWCEQQGYKLGSQAVFGKALKAAYPKVHQRRSHGIRYYLGIELLDD